MAPPRSRAPEGRRRASHSMDAVLSEAVALLDEAGEAALTFRALAQRLGGGVASIYWYVSNKDELLDRAADHALTSVQADIEALPSSDDAIDDLREIALNLFEAIVDRPWLASYFMRNTELQPNSLQLYETIGAQTLRLDLTARQRFHAVSAIVGIVIGAAADLGQTPTQEMLDGNLSRAEYLKRAADKWRVLDATEFPFVHEIVDEFEVHADEDQFRSSLDLALAGLRLQANA